MPFKLATWNINSIRLRIGLVTRFLAEERPDVLCLQETKCPDDAFPEKELRRAGYGHIAKRGQKGYHGVAIVSRLPLDRVTSRQFCGRDDARHVAARVAGLELHNFYVPAGGDTPDPETNEKFAHKLAFLDEMAAAFRAARGKASARRILVGDLNVAPLENDVWSHRQMLKVVSHTPAEVARLRKAIDAHDWIDVPRLFTPPDEKLYSWWSYRAADWAASDRGRRLDHIWASPALAGAALSTRTLRTARGWDRPSDHVPVIAEFGL